MPRENSPELYKQLQAVGTSVRRKKGTILFRAGRPARGAFVVRSGQVRVTLNGDSNLYRARVLGPGAIIGLPATFSGEPYSLTAEVTRDCSLSFIPRRRLQNLLLKNPEAGLQIARMLSEEISIMRSAAKRAAQSPYIVQ